VSRRSLHLHLVSLLLGAAAAVLTGFGAGGLAPLDAAVLWSGAVLAAAALHALLTGPSRSRPRK